ncbi:MAG: lysine--tRNA ligase, partial [Alphaproteobacteria bacterium]|nr:lysine--tRNA ligase [Alphaproteobacteria bacterium]
GLSMEEWLKYAPAESLSLFMYQKPKTAKRLYFDVIPRATDEYLNFIGAYGRQEDKDKINNPVWHIHNGNPPKPETGLSFGILLNLVSVCHSEDPAAIWKYIMSYAPEASPEKCPYLSRLVPYAIAYYNDFVKPTQKYRLPTEQEKGALNDLKAALEQLDAHTSAEDTQTLVYEIGKKYYADDLKAWFKVMYETLLGQSTGPRMGSFIALYGIKESIALITDAVEGKLAK